MQSTTTCTYGAPYVGFSSAANQDGRVAPANGLAGGTPSVSSFQWSTSTCVTTSPASGGSSYIIDVGTTVMLGGLLMFFIAYWFIGLVRTRSWNI